MIRPLRRFNINTSERNRIQKIFGSAQCNSTQAKNAKSLAEVCNRKMPEDKSEQVHFKNALPTSIKFRTQQRDVENPTMG